MIRSLWTQREIDTIRSMSQSFGALLDALHPVAVACSRQVERWALLDVELCFLTLRGLDSLRSKGKAQRLQYCEALANEIYDHLARNVEAAASDLRCASCLVTVAVAHCLYVCSREVYLDEILRLHCAAIEVEASAVPAMMRGFRSLADNLLLRRWLVEYMCGAHFLSGDMERLLANVPAVETEPRATCEPATLITNYYQPGSCHFAAGSTMNGAVI